MELNKRKRQDSTNSFPNKKCYLESLDNDNNATGHQPCGYSEENDENCIVLMVNNSKENCSQRNSAFYSVPTSEATPVEDENESLSAVENMGEVFITSNNSEPDDRHGSEQRIAPESMMTVEWMRNNKANKMVSQKHAVSGIENSEVQYNIYSSAKENINHEESCYLGNNTRNDTSSTENELSEDAMKISSDGILYDIIELDEDYILDTKDYEPSSEMNTIKKSDITKEIEENILRSIRINQSLSNDTIQERDDNPSEENENRFFKDGTDIVDLFNDPNPANHTSTSEERQVNVFGSIELYEARISRYESLLKGFKKFPELSETINLMIQEEKDNGIMSSFFLNLWLTLIIHTEAFIPENEKLELYKIYRDYLNWMEQIIYGTYNESKDLLKDNQLRKENLMKLIKKTMNGIKKNKMDKIMKEIELNKTVIRLPNSIHGNEFNGYSNTICADIMNLILDYVGGLDDLLQYRLVSKYTMAIIHRKTSLWQIPKVLFLNNMGFSGEKWFMKLLLYRMHSADISKKELNKMKTSFKKHYAIMNTEVKTTPATSRRLNAQLLYSIPKELVPDGINLNICSNRTKLFHKKLMKMKSFENNKAILDVVTTLNVQYFSKVLDLDIITRSKDVLLSLRRVLTTDIQDIYFTKLNVLEIVGNASNLNRDMLPALKELYISEFQRNTLPNSFIDKNIIIHYLQIQ